MNKLMDWMKGKFMKYHISDREYDMIQKDMQEENRNSLLFFSVITILFLIVMLLISFCSPLFVRYRSAYILLMLVDVLILAKIVQYPLVTVTSVPKELTIPRIIIWERLYEKLSTPVGIANRQRFFKICTGNGRR